MKKIIAAVAIITCAYSVLYAAQSTPEPAQEPAGSMDNATRAGHILLSLPGIQNGLTRPEVNFDHEKHSRALGETSCRTCHADNQGKGLIFTFPKNLPETDDEEILMNAWHNACIACHNERSLEDKQTGPITCGQCHIRKTTKAEHVPILPPYYEPVRDTYHGKCLNCHSEPMRSAEDAPMLDWKKFQILRGNPPEEQIPKAGFDYQRHALHSQTLDKDCGLCHYLPSQKQQELEDEGLTPQCRDWLLEPDPEGSWRKEDYAHTRCVNCHFTRTEAREIKTGPLLCGECHTATARTPEQMLDVVRSDCQQKEKILIRSKEITVMDAVPFNHAQHQLRTQACQDCHHNGIQPCHECHTKTGDEKAEFVTLAQAFHRESSSRSCVGCHETQKQKPECAGCHQQLSAPQAATGACATCHSNSLEALERIRKAAPPEDLIAPDVQGTWQIEKLGEDYAKVQFNHLEITQALKAVSDASPLARYFHTNDMTLCAGCHHYSPLEPKKKVPSCRTCHDTKPESMPGRPDLMGAYHQQCLGCHRTTGAAEEKMPQTCNGCHAHKQQ